MGDFAARMRVLRDSYGISPALVLTAGVVLLIMLLAAVVPAVVGFMFGIVLALSPIWLPVACGYFFWKSWILYRQSFFLFNEENVLLEVRLGPELLSQESAMEVFLLALHVPGGELSFAEKYLEGRIRPLSSLEICAQGGVLRFFIRVRESERSLVEARLRAQFPDVEVERAEDYARMLGYDETRFELYGTEYSLTRPDPYPIKTYSDYALGRFADASGEEDPLLKVLRTLASRAPEEVIWIQILLRAHKAEAQRGLFGISDKLHEDARVEIEKILGSVSTAQGVTADVNQLSKREQDTLAAIERSLTKQAFDCGLRVLYIAPHGHFDHSFIGVINELFAPFGHYDLNSFAAVRWLSTYRYSWQDWNDMRKRADKRRLFDVYRRRAYFYAPYSQDPFILNIEELATLFHFPGASTEIPGIERVGSRKVQPPENLPV